MTDLISPFRLKWAGGKRWLASALVESLGTSTFAGGLCEPFAGGAALTFAAGAVRVHLSDTNSDLIETYRAIQRHPSALADRLRELTIDRESFHRIREQEPTNRMDRAVRMIFLNRTAFGGLWRVNAEGRFNVPFGCKPETRLPDANELYATSRLLAGAQLDIGDFVAASAATPAQVVYFDPPYTVAHNINGFVRYNERIFSWSDQERLATHVMALACAGKVVLVSNAFHEDLRALYRSGPFKMYRLRRVTNLAADVIARGCVDELLVVSKNARLNAIPRFASRVG